MEQTDQRWANRCLPLLMANESGWALNNPTAFTAVWDGGTHESSVKITLDDPLARDPLICSVFGYGIVTWTIPYIFRTDPGWNLLARGPANSPKDGVSPLEGLIETDWLTASFTMNWKLTRPGLQVRFEEDEPFCVIVPQRRHDLERFQPETLELADEAGLEESFRAWERSRDQISVLKFVSQYGTVDGFEQTSWEKHYFRGVSPDGSTAPEHQTKQRLQPFRPVKP